MKTVNEIIDGVCDKWGITRNDLLGRERINVFVIARKEAARELRGLGLSYPSIGRILGNRDHSSIIHYFKKDR